MWEGFSVGKVEGRLHPQGCVTHVEHVRVCLMWCGLPVHIWTLFPLRHIPATQGLRAGRPVLQLCVPSRNGG